MKKAATCDPKEALHWEALENKEVRCRLCPWQCRLKPGGKGTCRVRLNEEGQLVSLNYGCCTSYALDPVEKKPLYHFWPGSTIFSVGTMGCNFRCRFCQNWQIAQGEPDLNGITPEEATALAQRYARTQNCVGLAYTYSEPVVWFEFVVEAARLAREQGLKNVLVTNGFIGEEALDELLPLIDAMNIDVKGFTDDYYLKVCRGKRGPVLRTAEKARLHCHVELTTLLVTGLNDSEEEIGELVDWVAGSLGTDVPVHFSRYFPNYELDLPPTPVATLIRAREVAREKLQYVYLGNVAGVEGNDTHCPRCGNLVIERKRWSVRLAGLDGRNCVRCGNKINVIV